MIDADPYPEHAFTLYKPEKDQGSGTPPLFDAYFEVRSPHLRKVFEAAIGQMKGIEWAAKPLRVREASYCANRDLTLSN